MLQEADDVETDFYRAFGKDILAEAFFDFQLNTRDFLDKIQEIHALAQLQESDTELAMKVLISTRACCQREIKFEIMSAVAEQVAMLRTNRVQQSSWLQNAEMQAILTAYFDKSVSIRDFDDKSRGENANILKAALMCSRLCLFRASKQVQAMERTSDVSTIKADNSGGIQPAPVKFVIEEQSVIEIFNPKLDRKVGNILIKNDSAEWCAGDKDPPVADESSQRRRPRIMSQPDHQSAVYGG